MGLYLCVFEGDVELDGIEVGTYEYWGSFLAFVQDKAENGIAGSRFPILRLHPEYDGEWSHSQCKALLECLQQLKLEFSKLPQSPEGNAYPGSEDGTDSLYTQFRDVDGSLLLDRMIDLCGVAIRTRNPLLLQ